jgi:hypothetical protein
MTKEFIPYEQNLEIRNLGFDEPCIGFYNIDLDVIPIDSEPYTTKSKDGAILYQQAFRWFREKHNIVFYLNMVGVNLYYYVIGTEPFLSFKTYEEAELACLKKLIEIIKK